VQIPVVLYSLLEISTPSGLKANLMVSNRQAAISFATTFGAEDPRKARRWEKHASTASGTASANDSEHFSFKEREEPYRSAATKGREEAYQSVEALEREARLGSARKVLGVAKGASAEQISAAYRKLARTHHPDKVANLAPAVRDRSERRMKEINAAYTELKRLRRNLS
jgi:hypothetical protein